MALSKKTKGEQPEKVTLTPASEPETAPAPAVTADAAELAQQLEEKTAEAQEQHDRVLRLAAEMENLKKRHDKERSELLRFANENLIKELLPVVDNLERALDHSRQADAPESFVEGIDLVHQGFLKALGQFGVTPIVSVGQPFDPNFHNAVMQEEAPAVPDRTVLKELQKGYLLHQRLLRPAMVVVARNHEETSGQVD